MKRKIVQITSAKETNGRVVVFALADDGTIWMKCHSSTEEWIEVPTLPEMEMIASDIKPGGAVIQNGKNLSKR